MKYRIGEVAKIFGVSAETLRHYDRIGLLVPKKNTINRYRYYTEVQFELLYTIMQLSNLGIHLERIKDIVYQEDLSKLQSILIDEQKQVDQRIEELKRMKAGIAALTHQVDKCMDENISIEVKSSPEFYTVIFPMAPDDHQRDFDQFIDASEKLPVKWFQTTEYVYRLSKSAFNGELTMYSGYGLISEYACDPCGVEVLKIPSQTCVVSTFIGKAQDVENSYIAMYQWLKKQNYKITGDTFEIYKASFYKSDIENTMIIEIWIPVEKKA